jgi:hypothetical protein
MPALYARRGTVLAKGVFLPAGKDDRGGRKTEALEETDTKDLQTVSQKSLHA